MATGIAANRLELLQIADAVAREKGIEKEIVIASIEEAIQKAARTRYGMEHDIRVNIDPKTGVTTIKRVITVVEDDAEMEGELGKQRLTDALYGDKEAVIGKTYEEELPPFEFGRVQTQMARQVVFGKVREAERERQFEEYKDRVGEIVNGVVKRVEYGNTVVDLGRGEGIMRRDQSIPRENFNIGDRIRCYIYDVRRETKGPQILLSRAHGGFMAKLFAQEVPEVYDGVIEIRAVARDPGSRAKMAVVSNDSSIDPSRRLRRHARQPRAGGCGRTAGRKDRHHPVEPGRSDLHRQRPGARRSLQGRHGRGGRAGRGGGARRAAVAGHRPPRPERPPRLPADRLADRHHDREPGERAPSEASSPRRTALFQEALDVDEVIAQLLVTEGFATVEDVAYVENA